MLVKQIEHLWNQDKGPAASRGAVCVMRHCVQFFEAVAAIDTYTVVGGTRIDRIEIVNKKMWEKCL